MAPLWSRCFLSEHRACTSTAAGRLLSVAFIGSNIATGALFVILTECFVPCVCSTPAFHDCHSFSRLEIMSESYALDTHAFSSYPSAASLSVSPFALSPVVVLVYLVSHARSSALTKYSRIALTNDLRHPQSFVFHLSDDDVNLNPQVLGHS